MPNHPLTKRAKPLSAEEMRTDLFQEHLRVFGELPHHRSSSAKITADIEERLEAAAGKAKDRGRGLGQVSHAGYDAALCSKFASPQLNYASATCPVK